jgi:hypothetical protein
MVDNAVEEALGGSKVAKGTETRGGGGRISIRSGDGGTKGGGGKISIKGK